MACTLTTGRKIPCKSAFGGIKKVYFADFGGVTAVTVSAGTGEAAITGTPTWYEYDVKGAFFFRNDCNKFKRKWNNLLHTNFKSYINLFRCFNAK